MFPSFIGILDIQSWWEVPSIAYFCSLFRTAFNLLDFDIEELEEALLTDGSEECASSLLTELIVRLLNGCLGNNDISAFNYQMFLRRLFRQKCQETGRYNPFNTDIDFQFLPLRTKVEILYALCDFRLDGEDVFDLFKNLEAESLRVEPLGWDDKSSAYWYFYGTRLYREDYKQKSKSKKKKREEKRKKQWKCDDWLGDQKERVWQVVCFTEADWTHLTEKFKTATSRVEKELYQSLSENFLPEIPRLFQEKERLQRKRLLELAPRRTSSRVLQKIKQKEEEDKLSEENSKEGTEHFKEEEDKKDNILGREHRAKRRDQLRTQSVSSESSNCSSISEKMSQKVVRRTSKSEEKKSKNSKAPEKGEPPPEAPVKTGRKTNNSLACATGQIVIPDTVESTNSNRKKLKTSQIFSQTEEDIQTDMYKVLEQLTAHEDAWPFMEPVEEEYAPNYYAVIRRPMDLNKMEERLDNGYYAHFAAFEGDFKLIVNNCRLYNGQDNEYTVMVDNLQNAFDKLTERYIHRISSSDEEIAVEYQVPTPSRKHKLKAEPSPTHHGKKKKRTQSGSGDKTGNSSPEREKEISPDNEKPDKESPKVKDGKIKKKRKGHHHHSKHSKSHKKTHDKTSKNYKKEAKHLRKQKHLMKKERSKQRRKKRRHSHKQEVDEVIMKRSNSLESLESPSRSRSASPLPSIHTPSPSPTPSPPPLDHLTDPDFFKDKYDKIKERRRQATKDNWDSLVDYKKSVDPQKQNLSIPEKDKNHKLRETIEKLKAKNEKYKETLMFNNLYNPSCDKSSVSSEPPVQPDTAAFKEVDEYAFTEDRDDNTSQKAKTKKGKGKKATKKVSAAKNESATEALEQAVKDISMWLDDTPKVASHSSPSNSPALTISTEEQDSRLDDDFTGERSQLVKKDSRKRPSSREPKLISKRRELQRTIERLQPGKSKGNLLTNISTAKTEEVVSPGPHNKSREIKSVLTSKTDELSPKLSLGSVLPAVGFTLGKDHKFDETVSKTEEETPKSVPETEPEAPLEDEVLKIEPSSETPTEEKGPEPTASKFSQEKATPNLSAWFKAFGAPKSTHVVKKKNEESEQEERQAENSQPDKPPPSPKNVPKFDSPPDGISPTQEGGDSPVPNVTTTPRQRRTSTGSSISERSSFSQDLDSPRHQITHTSPLLRSPASPRIDEFQKISYPIINGTVRAGFYQDTASIRSSPEKSCSPREGPQSPYSPYSQHVYATNSTGATPNPNYFMDQNRSPLPTYGQIQPLPYYDSSRLVPEASYQASGHMASAYSPGPSPYTQHSQHSPYSHPQHSPYSHPQNSPLSVPHVSTRPHSPAPAVLMPDARTSLYPVKKRTYNEPEISVTAPIQASEKCELKNMTENHNTRNKEEFQQKEAPSSNDMLQTSRDEIVISLSKKSESLKANTSKEKCGMEFMERPSQVVDIPDYSDGAVDLEDKSKLGSQNLTTEKHTDASKGGAIDMVNMGYFVPEPERRSDISDLDLLTALKEMQKLSKPRHLDTRTEPSMKSPNVSNKYGRPTTPEVLGTIEKIQNELHNMCYEKNQSPTDFTLKDVEIASKKVFSGGTVSCNNWNQTRKQDIAHPNYQSGYVRTKSNINIPNPDVSNFNKALHSQQLEAFAGARAPAIRGLAEHNLPSELRIPNPRGMLNKNDLMGQMSMQDNDMLNRNVETSATHKMDKTIQNQPLASSLQYKPPYSNHSSVALDTLQNIPNLPQMLERYTNDERYLSSFSTSSSSLYHEKTLQMAQMFNKSVPSDVHSIGSSASIYSQSTGGHGKDNVSYKASISPNVPSKARRKRATEPKHAQGSGSQTFHTATGTTDPLSSVKTSLVPGSAFNFGPSAGMGLSGSLYSDNSGFSFSNSTANQLMAANYMAAAAAAHQRSTAESNVDKLVKPAHQNSAHTSTGSFPFMGHSQVRAGYPFVGSDPSSPLYQQYFQRHQEEILRQTGAQIMGLYPPGYPASLAARQPYDSINRPSWL